MRHKEALALRHRAMVLATTVIALLVGTAVHLAVAPQAGASHDSPTATPITPTPNFGPQQRGTASSPKTVTLRNTGDQPLQITRVVLAGPAPDQFTIDDSCSGKALPGDGSCSVVVRFQPTRNGPQNAVLRFETNDPRGPADVALSGTGTGPIATVAPGAMTFSAVVGTTAAAQQARLANTGNAPLNVTAALVGPSFAVARDGCTNRTLAPGESCTVDVTFTPVLVGSVSATLQFSGSDPTNPNQAVALTGTGAAPGVLSAASPGATAPPPPLGGTVTDRDGDGVPDTAETCPRVAGDLKNGCPSELNADVVGRWRVNNLLSQLLSLRVRAPVGSRIELRCGGRPRLCPFRVRIIARTTRRTTGLTRYFPGRRILAPHVIITIRVTKPQRIGVYERLQTRTGRRLPKVTQRCIGSRSGAVRQCPA